MIQRIQTIYLLLIAGLMLAMLFMPLGYAEEMVFTSKAIIQKGIIVCSTWGTFTIISTVILNALISISLYKKRALQIRLSIINIFQMILIYGVFFFSYFSFLKDCKIQPAIALSFPIIAIIFNLLAIRSIRKDEKLIKSLDRIR